MQLLLLHLTILLITFDRFADLNNRPLFVLLRELVYRWRMSLMTVILWSCYFLWSTAPHIRSLIDIGSQWIMGTESGFSSWQNLFNLACISTLAIPQTWSEHSTTALTKWHNICIADKHSLCALATVTVLSTTIKHIFVILI